MCVCVCVCVCVTDVRNLTLKTLFINILFPSFDLISSLKKYYFQKFLSKLVEVERKRFLFSAVVQRGWVVSGRVRK